MWWGWEGFHCPSLWNGFHYSVYADSSSSFLWSEPEPWTYDWVSLRVKGALGRALGEAARVVGSLGQCCFSLVSWPGTSCSSFWALWSYVNQKSWRVSVLNNWKYPCKMVPFSLAQAVSERLWRTGTVAWCLKSAGSTLMGCVILGKLLNLYASFSSSIQWG